MTSEGAPLDEGWYLMSTEELEQELARWRSRSRAVPASGAVRLSIAEALDYRDRGNLPDEHGRSLRLVIHVDPGADESPSTRRLLYEPDFHEAPTWRRPGSRPVNVVPLRVGAAPAPAAGPWWEQPDVAALEGEWGRSGEVEGIAVPAAYRGFV